MFKKILITMRKYIPVFLNNNTIVNIQRKLIGADIFIKTEDFIVLVILMMLLTLIISTISLLILNASLLVALVLMFLVPVAVTVYICYKNERRTEKIESDLSDYLRQLSALINVGYGMESAFMELSKTVDNPLNDEIKRALLETNFGRAFNESLMDIAYRNNSENLRHVFQIIVYSNESGGNVSDVLESIAKDLSDMIMLKKERKASVMSSVMFLLISSTVATPFALGMTRLYSDFIGSIGRMNSLESVIPLAAIGYVVIQSALVSILIGIILYSNVKKGILFMIITVPFSLMVYYCSQFIFKGILGV